MIKNKIKQMNKTNLIGFLTIVYKIKAHQNETKQNIYKSQNYRKKKINEF